MKLFLASIFLLLAMNRCAIYVPQTADIPLISNKNDLRIDAGVAAAFTAGTATISYGVTDKLAVQAYGTYDFNDRYFYQGAFGYYKNLPNQKVMEIYIGAGNGYGHVSNHDTGMQWNGDYQVYFTQFNFGKLGNENSIWDLGFGVKSGLLHSNVLVEPGTISSPPIELPYSYIINRLMIEPNVFTRIGGKHLKLNIKVGGLFISGKQFNGEADYFPVNLSLGLNYRL